VTDKTIPSAEEIACQARQHLASLRAAGIEWLPNEPAPNARVPVEAAPPGVASLFAEVKEPAPAEMGLEDRRRELTVLAQQVSGCTRCAELASTRTQTVFGVGNPGAELCFIGEAPGADEDAKGEPFVGPAGQLLNRIIAACGLKREEVYI